MIVPTTYPAADMPLRMQVAQQVLGPLLFDGTCADLDCPGTALHTVKDKRKARLYLDGAPTVTCFHSSCLERLRMVNDDLRRQIYAAEVHATHAPRALQKWFPQTHTKALEPLQDKYWSKLGGEILRAAITSTGITTADLWEASPVRLPVTANGHFEYFLRHLWAANEILWMGQLFDSGKPRHSANFKRADQWLQLGKAPGPLTCPWVFIEGAISRCKEQAARRQFLVLESDKLTQTETASVFWWLKEKMQLRLRAVIHSGNKSLHGWFDLPAKTQLNELEAALPHTGFDPKLFAPSQPCRLPGWHRTDKAAELQRLLYLEKSDL